MKLGKTFRFGGHYVRWLSIMSLSVVWASFPVFPVQAERIPNPGWKCPNGRTFDECGHTECGQKWLCTSDAPGQTSTKSADQSPLDKLPDERRTSKQTGSGRPDVAPENKATLDPDFSFLDENQSYAGPGSDRLGNFDRQSVTLDGESPGHKTGAGTYLYPDQTRMTELTPGDWVIDDGGDGKLKMTPPEPSYGETPSHDRRAYGTTPGPGDGGYVTQIQPYNITPDPATQNISAYDINGICNSYGSAVSNGQLLSNTLGIPIKQVYSESRDEQVDDGSSCSALTILQDGTNAVGTWLGTSSAAQSSLLTGVEEDLMNGKEVRIFAHSRGSAEAYNVVNDITNRFTEAGLGDKLANLKVITIGGYSPGPDQWPLGMSPTVVVNEGDPVPWLRGSFGGIGRPSFSYHPLSEYLDVLAPFGNSQWDPGWTGTTIVGLEPRNTSQPEVFSKEMQGRLDVLMHDQDLNNLMKLGMTDAGVLQKLYQDPRWQELQILWQLQYSTTAWRAMP